MSKIKKPKAILVEGKKYFLPSPDAGEGYWYFKRKDRDTKEYIFASDESGRYGVGVKEDKISFIHPYYEGANSHINLETKREISHKFKDIISRKEQWEM